MCASLCLCVCGIEHSNKAIDQDVGEWHTQQLGLSWLTMTMANTKLI
jgi:hypothetical protein